MTIGSMVVAVFVPVLLFVIVAIGLYGSYLVLPRIIRFFNESVKACGG